MPKLLKVGVLMGGPSFEHEISLATGEQILKNLDSKKYTAIPIKISPKGKWMLGGKFTSYANVFKKIDFAFLALHGEFGEDGKIQGLLDFHNISYSGSGAAASSLGMDKLRSRELFKLAGLTVPRTLHLKNGENNTSLIKFFTSKLTKFPVVVKPRSRGSSIGVTIAGNDKTLRKAINLAFQKDSDILIEEYINGTEVTCGVLDNFSNQKHFVLPVTQITPVKSKFFDYKAKYKPGVSKEITPAQIDETSFKKVQSVALSAHQILGCRGYSRADMLIRNNSVYLLEVNTLPGLTATSLLPQQAAAAGLSFSQLLDKIIERKPLKSASLPVFRS